VLRTADEEDVERVAAFNSTVHEPGVGTLTRHLFLRHPHTQLEDLIFVEDESGQIVSSLCLIPWTWAYEDVEIPAGEMGIVGTLEAYRRRGLVRAQVDLFQRRLRERGCLLSHIQGIPYYYRQFGYEYALPLEGGLRLELRHIPKSLEPPFTFRLATLDDLPTLMRLYEEAARDLAIHTIRDEPTWRYMMTEAVGGESECETWAIENAEGQTVGYVRLPEHHFGEELAVNEVSALRADAALAALIHLRALAVKRLKPGIRLNLPAACSLMELARSLGAHDLGTYAWQIHIPDFAGLLGTLAPVLERRIAGSSFAGLTREVRICLYRETIALRFSGGKLDEAANLGFTDWKEEPLRLSPFQFIPLVLGYRTLEEIEAANPDARATATSRPLIDTLCPKMSSFIYANY